MARENNLDGTKCNESSQLSIHDRQRRNKVMARIRVVNGKATWKVLLFTKVKWSKL